MLEKNKLSIITFFALLLGLVTYYHGLFIDLTGDAGKYAAIARHMLESGDYINLKIHGEPYDQKPPLLFWLATFGYKIGGLNNFSYKIFAVLYAFLGLFFTYKIGEVLYDKRTGKIAAYLLFFCECYFLYCMDVHTDLVLQTNVAFAIWQLAEYLRSKKTLNFILAFIGIGLAIMSKGPIGGAVPAFALGTHLIMKKDFKQLFHPKWILGIIIAMAIASPALIGLYNQFGSDGIKFFFWTNNIGRISGEYVGKNTDYSFYLHTLLYLFAPWSLLMYGSIYHEFRSVFKKPFQQKEYLLIGGILFYFIIISVARGKSPNYIFILIPLLAVLTAKWIALFLDHPDKKGFKVFKTMQGIYFSLLWVFLFIMMFYLFPSGNWRYWLISAVVLILCALIYIQKDHTLEKLLLPSILIISMVAFYMNSYMLPYAYTFQAPPKAARIFNEKAKNGDQLYNYLYGQYEVFFYGKTNAIQVKDKKQLEEVLKKPGSWIFTTEAGYDSIKSFKMPIDAVYQFRHRGMNKIGGKFIFPKTRESSLKLMFFIKTPDRDQTTSTLKP